MDQHKNYSNSFWVPIMQPGRGGGALKRVLYGEAPPQALTPYPFIYHFDRNYTPFVYLLLKKETPYIYLKDMA